MRFGKRQPGLPLSVCCITDQTPAQTAAAIAPLRAVAAEVVIGLDPVRADDLPAFKRLADRVVLVEHGPIEHNVAAMHQACRHDWVFRIDADELPSAGLIQALPGLVTSTRARQYAFSRRWLLPDGASWVDEQPWWPDFQVRLVRRSTAKFHAQVHAAVELDAPRLYVDEPIYHASAVLLTPRERQQKVLEYEVVHLGGPRTLRENTVTVYEPERFARRAPCAVPPEDRPAIAALLQASATRVPEPATSANGAAAAGLPLADPSALVASPGEARIEVVERELHFAEEHPRTLTVRVTNDSAQPWTAGTEIGAPGIALGGSWITAGGTVEGPRTLLPADLAPGESLLVPVAVAPPSQGTAELRIAAVDEGVRWLDGGVSLPTEVAPPPSLPRSRSVRPAGAAAPIPRVIHRVWLGDRPLPAGYERYGESWAELHPDWELRLWTDADAPEIPGLDAARNLAERSDLVRYELLRRHGGVYVDTDVECLRPIETLLEGVVAFSAYEVPGRLCNAVMGCVPGHPAFERLAALSQVTVGHGSYPEATATTFSTYVLERFDDVTLFEPATFYPELWDGRLTDGDGEPFTRHHWAKGWAAPALADAPHG